MSSLILPRGGVQPSYQAGIARSAAESANPALWDGLILAWMTSLGNTGLTLHDASGHHIDGTLIDVDITEAWTRHKGRLGFQCDGFEDRVVAPSILIPKGMTALTVLGWARYVGDNVNANLIALWRFSSVQDKAWTLHRSSSSNAFRAEIAYNGTNNTDAVVSAQNYDNEWQFVALTWSTTEIAIIVYSPSTDTLTRDTTSISRSSISDVSSTTDLVLGSQDDPGNYWDGQLSDFCIYNRVLPTSQIRQLYQDSLAPFRLAPRYVSIPVVATGITVIPDPVDAAGDTLNPTVIAGSLTLTTTEADVSGDTLDPTIIAGSLTLTTTEADATGDTVNPTVVVGSLTLTTTEADATGDTLDPTVVAGSLTLTTTEADAASDTLNPTVVAGSLTLTTTPADATGDTLNPTVVAGSLTLTTTEADTTGDTLNPTIVLGSTVVTTTEADAAGDTLNPTVVTGAITTTPADAAGDTLNPTVVAGSITLTTTPADAAGDTLNPTVIAGAITTTPADAVGDTLNPTVILGSLSINTTPADAAGDTLAPSTLLGSVTIAPTEADATGDTLNPSVILGAVTTTPADAAGDTLNPTVVLGSVIITTTPADAAGDTVDPSVILGALTTTPADAAGDTLNPTVILGSIAITPTEADAAGDTVDPFVITTGGIIVTPASADAVGDTVNPTLTVTILPTVLFTNLPRWIIASAATYFQAVSDGIVMNSPTLPLYVEGVDERTEDIVHSDHAELRYTGPFIKELSHNCYRIEVVLNLLITNQMSMSGGAYNIFNWSGAFQDSMLKPIPIYKLGDGAIDDQSLIGCLQIKKNQNERANVYHFGQISLVDRLRQTEVDAVFDMDIFV